MQPVRFLHFESECYCFTRLRLSGEIMTQFAVKLNLGVFILSHLSFLPVATGVTCYEHLS